MTFKDFVSTDEAYGGYILSSLMIEVSSWLNNEEINEGRKDRFKLANRDFSKTAPTLFNNDDEEDKVDKWVGANGGQKDTCEKTPLSGYAKHISAVQAFAKASPDNFAQVLMFSPLSANTPFAKHWDNFYPLMLILKHNFPDKVTSQEIEQVVDGFEDKYHALAFTIGGWKLDTIADIWSNRQGLYQELNQLAKTGDDVDLIRRLSKIKGVAPVKAGFIAQLIWGRAGCIDTHNIDIYSKVFPDMEKELDPGLWGQEKDTETRTGSTKLGSVQKYVNTLDKLKSRGIGTSQLWDVWVDFVESMYIMITKHGRGYYDMQGPALDKNAPEYDALKGITIPKKGIGQDSKGYMVPLVGGKVGMGASATHLPMEPDDALKQFHKIYQGGQRGSDAAHAVAFHKDRFGRPLDQTLGNQPTALHYFGGAVQGNEVDPDYIRNVIRQKIAKGGKKRRKIRADQMQGKLF